MLIISDTSALSALAEADLIGVLRAVFVNVIITESVKRECLHTGAPSALQSWMTRAPEWLSVVPDPKIFLPETSNLGAGEASSITFAWEHRPDSVVILDDRQGRNLAESLGLNYIGLLGLLAIGAQRHAVDFEVAIIRLKAIRFRMSDAAIEVCRTRIRQGEMTNDE